MGSGNSRNLDYVSLTSNKKSQILKEFKITYSDKRKKKLVVRKGTLSKTYHIISNKYKIKFKQESELIDFVCEMGRPFIITEIGKVYTISFLYSKNLK